LVSSGWDKNFRRPGFKDHMLLGLSSLMDILPEAINGFALHPLDDQSTLSALTNNRAEDGFLVPQSLPSNTFM
jgi:hypothetical protein